MGDRMTGKALVRLEDDRLLRGGHRFTDDHARDAAHVAFVRSPVAHGRVRDVDTSRALRMPGVIAVFVAEDLDGPFREPSPVLVPNPGLVAARTQRPLAPDTVHYAGQTVAMVVAGDRYLAEDAAGEVRLDVEPLPAVVDVARAAEPGAPAVHEDVPGNVAGEVAEETGDVEAALADSPLNFEWTFQIERSAGMPLEARAVVASYDDVEARLTVYDTTQSPAGIRAGLARLFGLDPVDVELVAPDIGGAFGAKAMQFYPEEVLIPWAARRLGRSVKWTEDRMEHFVGTNQERKQVHRVRVGTDAQGHLRALATDFVHDTGAFVPYGLVVPVITASTIPGPYRLGCYGYRFRAVYTNAVPTSPVRGAGRAEAAFVMERVVQRLARELRLDPIAVRRRNLIRPEEMPHRTGLTGQDGAPVRYDSGDYPAMLRLLEERIAATGMDEERDRARMEGRRVGLGVACHVEGSGLGPYEGAAVTVRPDGTATVAVSLSNQGQGHETTFAQIASDQLSLPPERVHVVTGDTRRMGHGVGTIASRSAVTGGNAVLLASRQVRERAEALAERVLEAGPGEVTLLDGEAFVAADASRRISLGDLALLANPLRFASGGPTDLAARLSQQASAAGEPPLPRGSTPGLWATAFFSPAWATFGYGMHAGLVEIDPDTFHVRVLRYVAIHDCGRMINPMVVKGQLIGSIVHGIGGALYERLHYGEDGLLQNGSFRTFFMPFATEAPEVHLVHVETPSPENPLGVKGVAESGVVPVSAVIAAALEDALGVPVDSMPISPAQLFAMANEGG